MLKNYLRVALRNIYRNKLYASTSVVGLGLGLSVCFLAARYLGYEFSFDNFADKGRVYEVIYSLNFGSDFSRGSSTPAGLASAMKDNFPEIESATSFVIENLPVSRANGMASTQAFCVADSNFLDVFGLNLSQGNARSCMRDLNSVVLTKDLAEKYFGGEEVIGRALRIDEHDCVVTGIIGNIPRPSSLSFSGILSNRNKSFFNFPGTLNWSMTAPATFIKVKTGTDAEQLSAKLPAFIKSTGGEPEFRKLELLSIKNLHFASSILTDFSTFEIKYLFVFSVIAILVLIVSVVNFLVINVTIFSKRAKEIGIRRVTGATSGNLVAQFLVENAILSFASLAFSFCVAELMLPWFGSMLAFNVKLSFLSPNFGFLILGISILFLNAFMSIYSASLFSSMKPGALIHGQMARFNLKERLRKGLLTVQFVAAVFLICCTIVVMNQMSFINHKDLGFDRNQLLIIDGGCLGSRAEVMKNMLKENSDVVDVTESRRVITEGFYTGVTGMDSSYKKPVTLLFVDVDEDFIPTLGMGLERGRNFNRSFPSDSGAAIVNEEALRELNISNPFSDSVRFFGNTFKVIGVVKDFNYSSLRNHVEPVVFRFAKANPPSLGVRIKKGKIAQVLGFLKENWKELEPYHELKYSFLDDDINGQYVDEDRMFDALLSGAIVAIFISLMGVFALSSFLAEVKTKEIAIRKVLGASVPGIIGLLSSGFLRLIIAATVIAWPAAFYIMSKWLDGFAYRIQMNIMSFVLAGGLVVTVALVTLVIQSMKAARSNPVQSLRYE